MYDRDCLYKPTSTNMYMYPTRNEILVAIAHNFAASFLMSPAGFLMRPAGFLNTQCLPRVGCIAGRMHLHARRLAERGKQVLI